MDSYVDTFRLLGREYPFVVRQGFDYRYARLFDDLNALVDWDTAIKRFAIREYLEEGDEFDRLREDYLLAARQIRIREAISE